MGMLDDLIETALSAGLVETVVPEADGRDAYRLRTTPRQITVWVRPNGQFSGAMAQGEQLSLGQVVASVTTSRDRRTPDREQERSAI